MEREDRDIQSFLKRARASMPFFYRAAYAITADRAMAESVLGEALVEAYLKRAAPAGSLGFRDGVLTIIRERALDRLEEEPSEGDWEGFFADPQRDNLIAAAVERESPEAQRMCVLRYGCGMTVREIASLMDADVEQVQDALNQNRLRAERALARAKKTARPFDRLAMRAVRQAMNRASAASVDADYTLRAVEAELIVRGKPRRFLRRALGGALLGALALVFAALVWLLAVLMEM
ncbi:MAG: sigma-70 family RNA polymerase sigma factor [Clostridia bacterium]|nr:sigma-70 family RNA polymerase sigma factor [Clostridia bacterium]